MRNIYLVRHGKIAFPDDIKRCIGRTEIPLDEEGIRQAENLGKYFETLPVTHVYSSPAGRCVETASILNGERHPLRIVDDLSELYMGEWENQPFKEIKKTLESEPVYGEKRRDGLQRFQKVMARILTESSGDIVCVAHAGINCCYLSSLLGTNLDTSRALPQPYGGFSRIAVYEDGRMVVDELGRMPAITPDEAECETLWKRYRTPEPVIRHCKAVAACALDMAQKLKKAGCPTDTDLVYYSALLHDIARTEKNHQQKGAQWLRKEGYPEMAEIICRHHDLSVQLPEQLLYENKINIPDYEGIPNEAEIV
ncbi:MAG: histidine phosphatase family protein, partial [Clostridiales bacterium]|nr:histidine phosphatase family protein [Clostridiales bacterium]